MLYHVDNNNMTTPSKATRNIPVFLCVHVTFYMTPQISYMSVHKSETRFLLVFSFPDQSISSSGQYFSRILSFVAALSAVSQSLHKPLPLSGPSCGTTFNDFSYIVLFTFAFPLLHSCNFLHFFFLHYHCLVSHTLTHTHILLPPSVSTPISLRPPLGCIKFLGSDYTLKQGYERVTRCFFQDIHSLSCPHQMPTPFSVSQFCFALV